MFECLWHGIDMVVIFQIIHRWVIEEAPEDTFAHMSVLAECSVVVFDYQRMQGSENGLISILE